MISGPTPPPSGGQRARNSMENSSDADFVFGLVALAANVLAITAWGYLSAPDDESLLVGSVSVTSVAP